MAASIPKEFQNEGRQLARQLLDALGRAVTDLASVDVAQLSNAERRRWAVQSVRMARLLATAFPQEVSEPAEAPPKPSRRKGLRAKERSPAEAAGAAEGGELGAEREEIKVAEESRPAPSALAPAANPVRH